MFQREVTPVPYSPMRCFSIVRIRPVPCPWVRPGWEWVLAWRIWGLRWLDIFHVHPEISSRPAAGRFGCCTLSLIWSSIPLTRFPSFACLTDPGGCKSGPEIRRRHTSVPLPRELSRQQSPGGGQRCESRARRGWG